MIDLNLCPFAKKELVKNRVRFALSSAGNIEQLLHDLQTELGLLEENPDIETTVLVHPHVLTDFLDYNQFLDLADSLIEALELAGVYQVASFHPDYQFAGTEPDAVENFSNRSPFPSLHILREDSLERVINEYPDTADIPERNIKLLNALGMEKMKSLLRKCTNET